MVEVLHAPHPEGLGLLLVVGGEHSAAQHTRRLRLCVHRRSSGVGCSRGRLRAHAIHCLNMPRNMVRARWIVCCDGRERSTAAPAGGREDRACAGCTPERHRTAVVFTAMHDVAARALGVARVPRARELAGSTARHAPLYTTCPLHTSVDACVAKRHEKKDRQNCFWGRSRRVVL